MRGRALRVVVGSVLLLAALLGAGGDVAVAAKAPVDVPGSMWVAQGLLKSAGSGERDLAVLPAIVGFGPLDDLAANDWGINLGPMDLDLIVRGTYFEKVPGKPVCLVDLEELETELADTIPLPPGFDLTLRSATARFTPKNKQGLETIRVFVNIKLQICGIDDRGRFRCLNWNLQYKGTGLRTDVI